MGLQDVNGNELNPKSGYRFLMLNPIEKSTLVMIKSL